MGVRRQCQWRKNKKKKIKSEQELELKRKQPEIDEKKQSLAEPQHQDFMAVMQNMQASIMKPMEAVVPQMNKR